MFEVESLISSFGYIGILTVIFMETGVLIGFIFPGDTLLFTAGIMAATDDPFAPLWTLLLGIPVAAAVGDQVGYFIGRRFGPPILRSRPMQWIGPTALDKTNWFFDRYGPVTVMLARFIGVVRTLTPVVAGVAHMNHRAFTFWSVLGCAIWGAGITALGYFLGGIPFVQEYMEIFIVLGVASVVVPVAVMVGQILWNRWRSGRRTDEPR